MEEGIVPGGGMALFNVSKGMGGADRKFKPGDISDAVNRILNRALEAPLRAIVENSGESADRVVDELRKEGDVWTGFNAVINKRANLKDAGIIDPLKVTRLAFMNAVSVASNYLTIGVAITNIPEKKSSPMGGGMPSMGGEDY